MGVSGHLFLTEQYAKKTAVIILAVRPASYTHKNCWGRIISKDMHSKGHILETLLDFDLILILFFNCCGLSQ